MPVLFEILLAGFVVTADLRIDAFGDDVGAPGTRVVRMIRLSKISDTDSGRPRRGGRGWAARKRAPHRRAVDQPVYWADCADMKGGLRMGFDDGARGGH